jgi:anti-sigma regulatory factor (Ser/Thr protein kinase)
VETLDQHIHTYRRIAVGEESQVGEVRRAVQEMAKQKGFSEEHVGRASLVATELATNLVKHSQTGGDILFGPKANGQAPSRGFEIISIDKGVGIRDIKKALTDGFSTAGSPGTGLGAVKRLSEAVDIHSKEGGGTVLVANLLPRKAGNTTDDTCSAEFQAICTAHTDGEVSGDTCSVIFKGHIVRIMMADGLGHGAAAAIASQAAVKVFEENPSEDLAALISKMHARLQHTRGAVVAIAHIDLKARHLKYAGVGNIEARVTTESAVRGCATSNGTVGVYPLKPTEFIYPLPPTGVFVMHTDGIGTRWRLASYPGLNIHNLRIVTALVYRDFVRKHDDATILALKV